MMYNMLVCKGLSIKCGHFKMPRKLVGGSLNLLFDQLATFSVVSLLVCKEGSRLEQEVKWFLGTAAQGQN